MNTIYKYKLTPKCTIYMPIGAEILSVHNQHEEVMMWVLANPQNANECRHFDVHGTGHRIPEKKLKFIGTVLMDSGSMVFHVFERVE